MKLYYAPGACSQAAHILLHEAELPHSSERVDIRAKKTAGGGDYFAINPKGAVPALQIGDEVLTENGAILQYIGDKAGKESLLPSDGIERYRVIEWVSWLSSELHKAFGPLFNPASSDEVKAAARDMVAKKLDFAEKGLEDRDYLSGGNLSIADPYLFVMAGWAENNDLDLARWPNVAALRERMKQRDSVKTVLAAEEQLQTA